MPTLRELDARFLRIAGENGHEVVATLADAQGVMFLCPKCFEGNRGPVGTHCVICWFEGVSQEHSPRPGRWKVSGASLDDLTLSPSVALAGEGHYLGPDGKPDLSSPGWHGYVQNGSAA